ncbi:MAG: hypothetical protein Q8L86_03085 [Vicinamibacterales bacterium]|nr:hypothetical protein [Vicinamibacterales bacterium]
MSKSTTVTVPSVEQRLANVERALTLISASAVSLPDVNAGNHMATPKELGAAMHELAEQAAAELFWIKQNAGARVLDAPAPDDDQVEAINAGGAR